jgi:uncharacterized caspase-like protein
MPRRRPGVFALMVLAFAALCGGATAQGPVDDTAAWNRDAIAVIIGNRNYAYALPEVSYAINDARAVRDLVRDRLGYRDGNIIDLMDATQAQMLSVFGNAQDHRGKLWSWVRPGVSDVFVFYSGHGVPGLRDKRGYLLPVDADPATPEINGVPLDQLLANLGKLEARSVTVMLDACFSGNSPAGWLLASASPVYIKAEAPAAPSGITVVTAAEGDQIASWDEGARHGLFTRHMLDALAGGRADRGRGGNRDGQVTLGELEAYLDDEMTYAARRQFRRVQKATVSGDPKTVLIPDLERRSPVPAAVSNPVPPAAPPSRQPGARYALAGTTVIDAQAFAETHWRDIRTAILAYYRDGGHVWDFRGASGAYVPSERISSTGRWRVVGVGADSLDVRLEYSWEGDGQGERSAAIFRVEIGPQSLSIAKMWR